jgi:hypothetical protein
MAGEDLAHVIDAWTDDGQIAIEVLARAKTYDLAVAAFEAAVKAEPYAYLRLSLGARVIRERPAVPWTPSIVAAIPDIAA